MIQKAKLWWKNWVNKRPIWHLSELPNKKYIDILITLEMAYELRREVFALGKPNTPIEEFYYSFFWQIVSKILLNYRPYLLHSEVALNYYSKSLSIPDIIEVASKNSNNIIELPISKIRIQNDTQLIQNYELVVQNIKIDKYYSLSHQTPESLLINIPLSLIRRRSDLVTSFMKAYDFNLTKLNKLVNLKKRTIIYRRHAQTFHKLGRSELMQLFTIAAEVPLKSVVKNQPKLPLPQFLLKSASISDANYVTRFRDQLTFYTHQLSKSKITLYSNNLSLKKILSLAEKNKRNDAYHSSTIEGYKVNPQEIDILMKGGHIDMARPIEEVERKMALKGYLQAYEFVIDQASLNFKKNVIVTEHFIKETYAQLFSPSLEAEILNKKDLTNYRNQPVFIRHSRYVPVNFETIPELMTALVEEINQINNFAIKAVIAHFGLVTIHPYSDGNGRLARFLMNYILTVSGAAWRTILIEDKAKYFKALEVAQCDSNIHNYEKVLSKYLR